MQVVILFIFFNHNKYTTNDKHLQFYNQIYKQNQSKFSHKKQYLFYNLKQYTSLINGYNLNTRSMIILTSALKNILLK
jgi:uncharacterized protein YjaZ